MVGDVPWQAMANAAPRAGDRGLRAIAGRLRQLEWPADRSLGPADPRLARSNSASHHAATAAAEHDPCAPSGDIGCGTGDVHSAPVTRDDATAAGGDDDPAATTADHWTAAR